MVEMQTCKRAFSLSHFVDRCLDCIVTLLYWTWFIFGFLLFYSWRYILAALFAEDTELAFQRLNCQFFRIFFTIVGTTAPRHRLEIDEQVRAIRSSVIVCNHLSYLDPLLFISIFQQHKTIVKTRFFTIPIFGRIITGLGYLPATGEGPFAKMMIGQMDKMGQYLQHGGNLFVFPEGTRSRNGKLGELHRGVFKIARLCQAPIYVLEIRNTDKLFTPGKFIFNTRVDNTTSVKLIGCIEPDYQHRPPAASELEQRVRQAYSERRT